MQTSCVAVGDPAVNVRVTPAMFRPSGSCLISMPHTCVYVHTTYCAYAAIQNISHSLYPVLQVQLWIADEDAIHRQIGMKGSGGVKPCALCVNVFNGTTPIRLQEAIREAPVFAVAHWEADHDKLVPADHDVIMQIARRLRDAHRDVSSKKGELKELQTRLGWSWDPELVQRIKLMRPTETICYDFMHVLFVSGVVQKHVGLLMKHAACTQGYPFKYNTLFGLIQKWNWPQLLHNKELDDVFSTKRNRSSHEAGTWRATASEALSCMPVSALLRSIVAASAFIIYCITLLIYRCIKIHRPCVNHTYTRI